MRRLSVLAAAPVAALLLTGAVVAQDNPSDENQSQRAITPEECAAEPRTAEDLAPVLGGGEAIESVTFQVPLGEAASAEISERVTEAVRGVIACLNAGDFLRGAALTTDNGARVLFGGLAANGPEVLEERLAAEPTARQEEAFIRLITITDVTEMPDGKLSAFVVINEPTRLPRGQETLLFVFEDVDGEVRFDNLVGFTAVPPEAPATPTADATPSA